LHQVALKSVKMNLALTISIFLTFLSSSSAIPAQSPEIKPQSFHIQGTITSGESAAPATEITFHAGKFTKTVITNSQGFYEAELPFGDYTMTRQYGKHNVSLLLRPMFRVTSPMSLVFNAILDSSNGFMNFSIPADDGTPFKLIVDYGDYHWFGRTYDYRGYHTLPEELHGLIRRTPMGGLVLLEYNLFTLRAERVIYHKKQKTIEAKGNVVFEDGTGKDQHAESMLLKIANGTLTPLQPQ